MDNVSGLGAPRVPENRPSEANKDISAKLKNIKNTAEAIMESLNTTFTNDTSLEKDKAIIDNSKNIITKINTPEAQKISKLLKNVSTLIDSKISNYTTTLANYDSGMVYKDPESRFRLFSAAAQNNHPGALYELGKIYLKGATPTLIDRMIDKQVGPTTEEKADNEAMAYNMFKRAADQNHPDAMLEVSRCLGFGIGVEKDLPAAIKLLDDTLKVTRDPKLKKEITDLKSAFESLAKQEAELAENEEPPLTLDDFIQ